MEALNYVTSAYVLKNELTGTWSVKYVTTSSGSRKANINLDEGFTSRDTAIVDMLQDAQVIADSGGLAVDKSDPTCPVVLDLNKEHERLFPWFGPVDFYEKVDV